EQHRPPAGRGRSRDLEGRRGRLRARRAGRPRGPARAGRLLHRHELGAGARLRRRRRPAEAPLPAARLDPRRHRAGADGGPRGRVAPAARARGAGGGRAADRHRSRVARPRGHQGRVRDPDATRRGGGGRGQPLPAQHGARGRPRGRRRRHERRGGQRAAADARGGAAGSPDRGLVPARGGRRALEARAPARRHGARRALPARLGRGVDAVAARLRARAGARLCGAAADGPRGGRRAPAADPARRAGGGHRLRERGGVGDADALLQHARRVRAVRVRAVRGGDRRLDRPRAATGPPRVLHRRELRPGGDADPRLQRDRGRAAALARARRAPLARALRARGPARGRRRRLHHLLQPPLARLLRPPRARVPPGGGLDLHAAVAHAADVLPDGGDRGRLRVRDRPRADPLAPGAGRRGRHPRGLPPDVRVHGRRREQRHGGQRGLRGGPLPAHPGPAARAHVAARARARRRPGGAAAPEGHGLRPVPHRRLRDPRDARPPARAARRRVGGGDDRGARRGHARLAGDRPVVRPRDVHHPERGPSRRGARAADRHGWLPLLPVADLPAQAPVHDGPVAAAVAVLRHLRHPRVRGVRLVPGDVPGARLRPDRRPARGPGRPRRRRPRAPVGRGALARLGDDRAARRRRGDHRRRRGLLLHAHAARDDHRRDGPLRVPCDHGLRRAGDRRDAGRGPAARPAAGGRAGRVDGGPQHGGTARGAERLLHV
ncbi:MAG: hypothetical protein AVDCRST_MAG30-3465, partial [uncultured Solirubrobacteraceae bacterium]